MEINRELGDNGRVEEIKGLKTSVEEELRIMCNVLQEVSVRIFYD